MICICERVYLIFPSSLWRSVGSVGLVKCEVFEDGAYDSRTMSLTRASIDRPYLQFFCCRCVSFGGFDWICRIIRFTHFLWPTQLSLRQMRKGQRKRRKTRPTHKGRNEPGERRIKQNVNTKEPIYYLN